MRGKMEKTLKRLSPPIDIVMVPDRTENFIVGKNFAKYRGDNFDRFFIGKVEEPIGESVLSVRMLLCNLTDLEIIEELGGYLKARITLADIEFVRKRRILSKGVVYIGYVEDRIRFPRDKAFSYINEKGEKCVIRPVCFWADGDWELTINVAVLLGEWRAGHRFLSGSSVNLNL